MRKIAAITLALITAASLAQAAEFRHIGDFLIKSRLKITAGRVVPVPIKPLRLSAFTYGVSVRISADGAADKASEYTIYRADGIGQQRSPGGPLEVVPGVQATLNTSGIFRQLRLTRDTLTITTFPGVSDQTIITRATLATDSPAPPAETAADR